MDDASSADGRSDVERAATDGISLGVVVTCYSMDRLADVVRLIGSIRQQSSPVDELVVVVQQSQELLRALQPELDGLAPAHVTLRFLDVARGVSHARNTGIAEVTSDVVAFVDDDSLLAPDWAAATRSFYREHPGVIGVAGAIMPRWDSAAMDWFPRELYWMLSCTYWTGQDPAPVRNGYGANMSFRREAFLSGRCFSEGCGVGAWGTSGWRGMGGEEPELALRVVRETGKPIMYVPAIRAWHRIRPYRLGAKALVRRAYWEGRLKAALSQRTTGSAGVLSTEFGLLRLMLGTQLGRLALLFTRPWTALRQQALVLTVVALVGIGFVEGKLRRERLVCLADRTPDAHA